MNRDCLKDTTLTTRYQEMNYETDKALAYSVFLKEYEIFPVYKFPILNGVALVIKSCPKIKLTLINPFL